MQIKNSNALKFIDILLDNEKVLDLESYDDQGVKVTTHTYDVLKISSDEIKRDYRDLFEGRERVDFFAVIVGVIIHDLSKGSIRKMGERFSHSQMMIKKPEYITKEADVLLEEIENQLGVRINDKTRKNIIHIVISHHGKWGKIQPNTKEAHIVHRADMYSAKYHRINPIGADKILELMTQGMNIEDIAKKLDCTTGIVKDRLKRAKHELRIKNTKQLLNHYKKTKRIPIGDDFFTKRVRETEKLIRAVNKKGFKNLVLENPLLDYLEDDRIFEEASES
ncbi:MAG: HD domain-containing protein [Cetobacterium sp.]|uniref:3'-5' exoribonuclease YhaM, can participate in 23S rRNA maturation, HD superfamily n=1 Tax=Cetobacterium ceti TaxID=180163 RepID=A0A1T4NYI9_9FUSO|nr:HD domain-containing protein [Cetobacterium ceti]MCJ8342083.1 HD domain-containing protein [Cetobacterium sp.]SJZ84086.1 3'-5' exoribonuclease YhaM, can participate in 23S rRNA maturation, HD superfamily [Cetobacterium ceti]